MDIEAVKKQAWNEALQELKEEYSNDVEYLNRLIALEKEKENAKDHIPRQRSE